MLVHRSLFCCALLLGLSMSAELSADTILVPAEQPTLQAAADAATAGDVVLIAKGVYSEAVMLSNVSNLTFRGQGKVILTPVLSEGASSAFDINFSGSIAFDSLEFEGFSTAIAANQAERIVVRDCVFRENTTAIDFSNLTQSLVRDCRFDSGATGVRVTDGEAIVLSENRFKVTAVSVSITDGSELIVSDNKCFGGAFGIFVGGEPSQLELLDNQIRDAANIGISLAGDSHQVRGNVLRKCGVGIRSAFGPAHTLNTIAGNRVLQSAGDAIFLRASQSRVLRNVVKKAGGVGIVADAAGIQVVRNVVSATESSGLRAVGNGGSFVGNRVKKSGDVEISVEGTSNFFADNIPATPFDL